MLSNINLHEKINKTTFPRNMSGIIIVFRKTKKSFLNWFVPAETIQRRKKLFSGNIVNHKCKKSGLRRSLKRSPKKCVGMNIEYDFWTMTMSCIIEDVEKIGNFTADHILSLFLQRWIYHLLQEIKFIYSEKATKFCEISTLLLTGTT